MIDIVRVGCAKVGCNVVTCANWKIVVFSVLTTGRPTSIAFSPDGHTLAGINADGGGGVILWDVTNPAEPHRLGRPMKAYSGLVSSGAFRPPDGHILVTGGWNAAVIFWDVTDPANAHEASRALTGYINVGSTEYRPNFVESVVFSADGKTMATASEDKTVTLWDTSNPAQPRTLGPPLAGHTGPVGLPVVSSEKTTDYLVTASRGRPLTRRLTWPLTCTDAMDRCFFAAYYREA